MGSKPKIYLATPFGFSPTQRQYLLPVFVKNLHALGNVEVHEPFIENEKKGIRMSAAGSTDWAFQVGGANRDGMKACDAVFAVVNGVPPDEGVCTELGIAIALGKPVFLFRDDYRRSANTDTLPLNLMVFSGMSATTWEDHYYTTMADLKNPKKALAKWVKSHADSPGEPYSIPPERRGNLPRAASAGPDLGASPARRTSKVMLQENNPPQRTKAPNPPKVKAKRAAPVAAPVPVATPTPPPLPQPSAAQKAAKKVEQMGFPLDEVFKIFTQFDTDGSGIISSEELEAMFVKLCNGKKVSKQFVDERRAEADLSGDGQIDFEEYVEFTTGEKIPGVEDLRKGFVSFPREKDGTIKVASFIDSVKSKFDSGVKLDRIIKEVDRNSDGKLSFSEYVKVQAMPDLRNKPISYVPVLKAPQTPHCFHKTHSPRANSPSPRPTTRTVRESPIQDQKTGRRLSKTLLQDDEPPPRRTSRDVPRSSSGGVAPSAPAPQSRNRAKSEPVEPISFKLTRPSITPDDAAELELKSTNLASTPEKPGHKPVVRAVIHTDNIPYNIHPERESLMGDGNRERPRGRSRSPYPQGQHRRGHSEMTRGAQANLMTRPPPAPVEDPSRAAHRRSQSNDLKRESGT